MSQIALDTNIAVDLLNGKNEIIEKLEVFEEICLPITVCGELLFGALNSGRSVKNLERFKDFIESCLLLNINSLIAEEYAKLRKELKEKGRPMPENDIWIGATCRSNKIPIFIRDKHFEFIEGITLIT